MAASPRRCRADPPVNKLNSLGETNRMIALLKRYWRAAVALPAISALVSGTALAQGYPTRNITLVVPFAAGSGTTTRIISQHLSAALGVGIVIDDKPVEKGLPPSFSFFSGLHRKRYFGRKAHSKAPQN